MKLPAATDTVLLEELARVVKAGWRLPDRSHYRDSIRHLLYLAEPKPTETYYSTARRFLEMLDETLILGAKESFRDDRESLLSDEQSRGLRILFGVHPEYWWTNVDSRRENAGAILLEKDGVKDDTYHRYYEREDCRAVLECLRARYGQEDGPSRLFESVKRQAFAIVGTNRRVTSTEIYNVFRSRADGLDFMRAWFYLREPDVVTRVSVGDLKGVIDHTLEPRAEGAYRLTCRLPQPVEMGQEVEWGYTRRYEYVDDVATPLEDRLGFSGRNDGYSLTVTVQFECQPPPIVWNYSRRKTYYHIDPPAVSLKPDPDGRYTLPETAETSALRVYGIAWRW